MCHPEVAIGHETPLVDQDEVHIPLTQGDAMPGLLTRPASGEGPAVLIVNDIFGRSPFYEDLAARLSKAGFVSLCLEYFFRLGTVRRGDFPAAFARRARLDGGQVLGELGEAITWLKTQPFVRGDRVGTIGFCMGGTFVLDLAATRHSLVSVCFYGFPGHEHDGTPNLPAPLDVVDQMRGPIVGFWGDRDNLVDMADVEQLARELGQRGVSFEHTIYPGLGHGFMAASRLDPDHEAYEAACDAWTKTLAFLRRELAEQV